MITQNSYVAYDTCNSREDISSWLEGGSSAIYSNRTDYKTVIEHHCDYKDKHSYVYGKNPDKKVYSNIYAHTLEVMIPIDMPDTLKHDFIKQFMFALSPWFKLDSFLYCYKFVAQGNGQYIHVLCFTRKYFKRQKTMVVKYTKDYYYSTKTKKLCKKDNPDAVLVHKKGDVKKDKNGCTVKETFFVAKTEKEIFKYTSFSRFHKRLLKTAVYAGMLLDRDFWKSTIKYFSRITVKSSSFTSKEKLHIKNAMITRLNSRIYDMQMALHEGKFYLDKAFHKLIHRIHSLIYLTRWSDPVSGSSIYLGMKQSLTCLKDNIATLEEHIETILTQWWYDEVYSVNDFSNVTFQNHSTAVKTIKSLTETDEYWKDANNNKWSKVRYSYEEALEFSRTLVNCRNCINCFNCIDCNYCTECIDCSYCTGCVNCFKCVFGSRLSDHHHYMQRPSNSGCWDNNLINTFVNLKEKEVA